MAESVKPLRLKQELASAVKPRIAENQPIARILVDSGLLHIDQEFDFLVPQEFSDAIKPGVVVKVPFNRKRVLGVVTARMDSSEFRGELRFIAELLRPYPLIMKNILDLALEVKRYYGGTVWDNLRYALPTFGKKFRETIPSPINQVAAAGVTDSRYPKGFWEQLKKPPSLEHRIRAWWSPPPYEDPFTFLQALLSHSTKKSLLLLPDMEDVERMVDLLRLNPNFHQVPITKWHSKLSRSEREVNFHRILNQESGIVVGVRGALFLPMNDLELIVMWDEGADSYSEQRAPYYHAREVAIMKAHLQKTHLIIAGYTPSLQATTYLQRGYLTLIEPERTHLQANVVSVRGILQDSDPNTLGRIPTQAWKVIKDGLNTGPVIIQVPQRGYVLSLSCDKCRNRANCSCGGKLHWSSSQNCPECVLCSSLIRNWSCQYCSSQRLRYGQVGDIRIVEEVGKAFPNQAIVASNRDHRVRAIGNSPIIVVATPGAEPIAAAGYSAGVVLNSTLVLERATLDAEEEARRRWFGIATLLKPTSAIFIDTNLNNRNLQALQRWDSLGIANRELAERAALNLPPAVKAVSLSGDYESIMQILRELPPGCEVSRPNIHSQAEPTALVRIKTVDPSATIETIFQMARLQSARGMRIVRIKVDPVTL